MLENHLTEIENKEKKKSVYRFSACMRVETRKKENRK